MDDYEQAELDLLTRELDGLAKENAWRMDQLGKVGVTFDTTALVVQELLNQIFPDPMDITRFRLTINERLRDQITIAEAAVKARQEGAVVAKNKLHIPGQ